jgi:hypothetical protein
MAKESDGERGAGKKRAKRSSKKAGAKARQLEATAADELAQPCLTLTKSAFIVGGCLPSGSHGPDDTLEETGLISENLRLIFRECVFNGVHNAGCEIDRGQIPNDADTEVGDVVQAVFQNSR